MLMDDPGAIEAVHLSYYRAGALCQSFVAAKLFTSLRICALSQAPGPVALPCACLFCAATGQLNFRMVAIKNLPIAVGRRALSPRFAAGSCKARRRRRP